MRKVVEKVMVKSIGEIGTIVRADEPQPNYLIKFDDGRYQMCTYYENEVEDVTMEAKEIESVEEVDEEL